MVFNATFTPVALANQALFKLGVRSTIASLQENSPEGAAMNAWYKISLAQTLEAFNWGFAKKRLTLVPHADDPPPDWGYRYAWDNTILKARLIYNPLGPYADAIPYTIETSDDNSVSILTDMAEAILVYTYDMTDDSFIPRYSPSFINAFTSALAANTAFTLTGNVALVGQKQQEFMFFIKQAAAMDANQTVDRKPREAEAIRGRH